MSKATPKEIKPFSECWEGTANAFRLRMAADGYPPEVAEWAINDARPRMERIVAGAHVEGVLLALEVEYLAALTGINRTERQQQKPLPPWVACVFDGSKKD